MRFSAKFNSKCGISSIHSISASVLWKIPRVCNEKNVGYKQLKDVIILSLHLLLCSKNRMAYCKQTRPNCGSTTWTPPHFTSIVCASYPWTFYTSHSGSSPSCEYSAWSRSTSSGTPWTGRNATPTGPTCSGSSISSITYFWLSTGTPASFTSSSTRQDLFLDQIRHGVVCSKWSSK